VANTKPQAPTIQCKKPLPHYTFEKLGFEREFFMSKPSIADAVDNIENLLAVMDDAYWEASSIEKKDCIYSIVSLLQEERAELAKLSIQDHGLAYEPVSLAFKRLQPKLNDLRRNLDDIVMRPQTAAQLELLISKVVAMIH